MKNEKPTKREFLHNWVTPLGILVSCYRNGVFYNQLQTNLYTA
jgi:hypothetical protein